MNSVTRKPSLGVGKLSKSMYGVRSVTGASLPELPPRSSRPYPETRSILPGTRYPTKDVAVDRHMADGRKRQVSGHQRLAVRRQLPQETDPDAGRLLGVVFEAV